MTDLRLPNYLDAQEREDGWWIVDLSTGIEIQGPFPTEDAARDAYADAESRPAE